ncbi:MAG: ABC transporter ATP-binding protein [Sulfobacillus sp.]
MIREEEALGKAYDTRLMKRLLGYARPQFWWVMLALVLTVIVTASTIVQPYLVKIAIDNDINTVSLPLVAYPIGQAPAGLPAVPFGGRLYVRVKALPTAPSSNVPIYTILAAGGQTAMIQGPMPHQAFTILPGARQVRVGTRLLTSVPVSAAAMSRFRQQDVAGLELIGAIFLAALLLAFLANYLQAYILNWVSQSSIFAIRKDVITKIERMPAAFFDKNPTGRLVTRATNDVEALEEMYSSVMVNMIRDGLLLVGVVVIMFQMNTYLALISIAVLPVVFVAANIYRNKARTAYRNVRLALARINAFLAENISGMRVVQTFQRQQAQEEKFRSANGAFRDAGIREIRLFAIFRPFMDFLYTGMVAVLVWFGGGSIIDSALTFGVVYAFIQYIQLLFQPINDVTQNYSILQSAMAASERLFVLLDRPLDLVDAPSPQALPAGRGRVVFDHVWFAYEEPTWVLRDVSFAIEPGQTVAFVGATGAGKTSIMSLLARFYDVQRGQVLVDGVDIRQVAQAELRQRIAVVHQDVFIFAGTIRQNIALNKPLTDAQIMAAAQLVGADRFITRLPHGYDEPVQERGSTFSTGQRQLLSLARAVAADPSILVLDEATSNIDTESEQQIQGALHNLAGTRTMIVVAHRLSTIQSADCIFVMAQGQIRESGTHQQLLAQGGLYYDLYRLQYKEDYNVS